MKLSIKNIFRYDFYDNHEVDLLRLDTSCVIRFKEAPAIEHGSIE